MKLIFLGNCAVYARQGDCGVLIDAPNGLHTTFDGMSESLFAQIAASEPPYDVLNAACFTHKHSDHYDKKRLKTLLAQRGDFPVFAPNGATPENGEFPFLGGRLQYFSIRHSGEDFGEVYHRVLLLTIGDQTIYVTGDADWSNPLHTEIISTYKPYAAIWNPNFVSRDEGRALLSLCARNFIYHMPVESTVHIGIARKAYRMFERYPEQLRNVRLIDTYPTEVEI
ncbi:MAG: hypothetical protein IJS31_07360 [Oscillospiraceae bacterium]|nr:hypothetical protein [Oscillospiraceae bacterium]